MRGACLLAMVLVCACAQAATQNTWAGTTGVWATAGNWSAGHVPTAAEDVIFPATVPSGGATITVPNGALANSLTFNNSYTLNSGTLTLTAANGGNVTVASTYTGTISSAVQGTAALAMNGPGTLTLSGLNTYTGATTINAGALYLGTKTVSAVTAATAAAKAIAPGTPGTTGTLVDSAAGGMTLDSNTTLSFRLYGTAAGTSYDQINLTTSGATLALGGATLNLALGYTPALGDTYTIINHTATGGLSGTFNGLAEGAVFAANGRTYTITYKGGAGYSVVLCDVTGASCWTGASSALWSDAGNWSTNAVPGAGADLWFGSGASNLANNNDIASGSFNSITFADTGYVIVGNGIALGAAGITTRSTAIGANTLNLPLSLAATATINNVGSLILGGAISGAGGLTVPATGTGTLSLSGANTFGTVTPSAGLTLNAGTLNINSATALGVGTFTILGGTIDNTSGGAITLTSNNAQSWSGNLAFTGTNDLNLGTGGVALPATGTVTLTIVGHNLTVGGVISGGNSGYTLTKAGAGTLTLSGANTFTSVLTLSAGTLNINHASALGAGGFTISGASTIDNTSGATIYTGNYGQSWNANFTFAGTNDLSFGSGSKTVVLGSNRIVTVNAGNLTIGNNIGQASTLTLTKAGPGTLTLGGAANFYKGATTVNGGTLLVTGSTDASSAVTVSSGATLTGTGAINGTVALGSGGVLCGTLTINKLVTVSGTVSPGTNVSTGVLNCAGGITFNSGSIFSVRLFGPNPGPGGYDQLNVTGTATLGGLLLADFQLPGGLSFTMIQGGTISGTFISSAPNPVTWAGRTYTLSYAANSVTYATGTPNQALHWTGNSSQNWSDTANWQENMAPVGGDSLIFPASGVAQYTSRSNYPTSAPLPLGYILFAGAGFTLSGTGVTLTGGSTALDNESASGANTISNPLAFATSDPTITCVSGGTLTVSGAVDNGGRPLTVASAGATTLSGVISGAGALSVSGAGTLTLTRTNTYTGATTINGGTVNISADNNLGAAPGAATPGSIVLNGGTLSASATFTLSANRGMALGPASGGGTGTLSVADTKTLTYAGVIANNSGGSGNLIKTGAGTLTLSGANTLSGGVTLSAGTLNINHAAALGNTAGTFTIAGGAIDNTSAGAITTGNYPQTWNADFAFVGTKDLNLGAGAVALGGNPTVIVSSGNLTVGGSIGGAASSLTKSGNGTLTFGGANTYTGGTTVNGGALLVNSPGPAGSSSAITVNAGATLGGTGVNGGAVVVNSGGTVSPGIPDVSTGILTCGGDITFNDGSALSVRLYGPNPGPGGYDQLSVTGTATLNGGNTTSLYPDFRPPGGLAFTVIQGGSISGTFSNAPAAPVWGGRAYTLGYQAGSVSYTTSAINQVLTWTGSNSGNWSDPGNWSPSCSPANGDSLVFPASGVTNYISRNDYGAALSLGFIQFTGAGHTLNTLNSIAVTLTGDDGTAALDNQAASGANTINLPLTSGAAALTVACASGGSLTVGGVISGTGGLTKSGAGTLTLGGANTYSGATTINGGTVSISADNNLGAAPGAATPGAIVLNGGTLSASAPFTLATFRGIALGPASGGGGTGTLGVSGASTLLTYGGIIADNSGGSGSLVKSGSGKLSLSAANTFTGGLTLSAGTLNINHAAALGTGPFTVSGGTLDNTSGGAIACANNNAQNWNGSFTFVGTNDLNLGTGAVVLGGNRTVTVSAGSLTVGGSIGGSFQLTKSGAGTLLLGGASTYTGTTTVNGGKLLLTGSLGSGSVAVNNGSTLSGTGAIGGAVTVTASVVSPGNPDSNPGRLSCGPLTFDSASTFSVQLNNSVPGTGYDQLNVTGAVNLNQCTLSHTQNPPYSVSSTLIHATGGIIGTFNGISEGGTLFSVGARAFTLTYLGNGGTDAIVSTQAQNMTWSGSTNGNWKTPGNWVGGLAPLGGDSLVFGNPGAGNKNNFNDYDAGTGFNSIQFTDSGYTLGGNAVTLTGGSAALSNNYAGLDTISAPLVLPSPGPTTISCVLNGTLTISGTGVISGTGGLTKSGAGTLVLSAANTYSGPTLVSAGTLKCGIINNALPAASILTVVGAGSTFDLNGYSVTIGGLDDGGDSTGVVDNSSGATRTLTVSVPDGVSTAFSGTIRNSGGGALALTKTGPGTLSLSGTNNSYTGTVTVADGHLWISSNKALGPLSSGTKTVDISSSTCGLHLIGNITLDTTLAFKTGSGSLINESGSNTIQGALYIYGPNASTVFNSKAGLLAISGNVTMWTSNNNGLALRGDGSGTISGIIKEQNAGSHLSVSKDSGAGTWTLSGNNTHTGATTVSAGTLLVNGTMAAGSAVSVNNGGTLGGTGTMGGGVTVNSGGTINPGLPGAVGTLTVGSLSFNGGAYQADLIDDTADQIVTAGAINLAKPAQGIFNLNAGGTTSPQKIFTLIRNTGAAIANAPLSGALTGTPLSVNGQPAYFTYTGGASGKDFDLVVAIPITTRETVDTDGNGRIDAIRVVTSLPLNDSFAGLQITVAGYTVTGCDTGSTANDNEFFVRLAEGAAPDTSATPGVQVTMAGSLGQPVDPAPVAAADKAKPVLMSAAHFDGSGAGVDANDPIYLTFSEPVTSNSALAADFVLPVTNDSYGTGAAVSNGQNTSDPKIITITLGSGPLLTPGGMYSPGALTPGSPTGIFVADGTRVVDVAGNTALVQIIGTAVDLLPGTETVSICWDDLTVAPRNWSVGTVGLAGAYYSFAAFPPNGLVAHNNGNVREKFTVSCSASSPANWTLASSAGLDQFEMKVDNGVPPFGNYSLDLAAGPQDIATQLYSGANKPFDLRFALPTSLTAGLGVQQTITVTITATKN